MNRREVWTGAAGTSVAADDWESHWSSFSAATERNPAHAFRRRLVLALLAAHGPPHRYFESAAARVVTCPSPWRTAGRTPRSPASD